VELREFLPKCFQELLKYWLNVLAKRRLVLEKSIQVTFVNFTYEIIDVDNIRHVSLKIATEGSVELKILICSVCKIAVARKLNTKELPEDSNYLEEHVASQMYVPQHTPYILSDD
jgi:hypothetical protein